MIDEKMIKWAIEEGFYDKEDIPTLNEIDEQCIKLGYNVHNNLHKIKGTHYASVIAEDGTESLVAYDGYIHESYEDAMVRNEAEEDILNEFIE